MKKIILALILVLFVATITVEAATEYSIFLPLIHNGTKPWMYVLAYPYREEMSYIYILTPAQDCKVWGYKEGDTIYVDTACNGELDPYPDEFPPECDFATGQWCQIEKVILDAKADKACGLKRPFNCVKRD